ncbi:MAG: helix-turn-helix domain-containing protein, partial [Proteobacteria bacterium]|nr:helix-turn-helix domain-containing protein [Pseudomonadota bacterium]
LRSLLKAAPTLEPAAAPDIAKASAQLLSACLSPALMCESDAPATLAASVAMICRFIDRRIGDPALDARMLCSAFGLSRSALYRLFAPIGGVSDYIRQRRLARARLALNASARGRGGIGKIARQFGFSSDDAFSRAFKAQFGIAPRDAAHLRLSPSLEAGDGSLANWLRHLA